MYDAMIEVEQVFADHSIPMAYRGTKLHILDESTVRKTETSLTADDFRRAGFYVDEGDEVFFVAEWRDVSTFNRADALAFVGY